MAGDEPRRSGRATKGQHKNLEEEDESTPKPKKTGKANKGSKKGVEPDPTEDEDDDVAEEIRCVCGDDEDNVTGRAFIACDACEVWQHNICMGVPVEEDEVPEHYFCEKCRPEEHKELLEAIERGEQLWLERQKAAKNNRRKSGKKGKKGGRQSKINEIKADVSDDMAISSPAPVTSQETGTKRKFEEEPIPATTQPEASAHSPSPAPDQEPRRASGVGRADKRRKSSAVSAKNGPDALDVDTALVEIEKLPKERQNVAVALSKLVSDGVRDRTKTGQYRIPDGHTADSLGKHHASRLEYALHMNHGSRGNAYGQQFRQVNANLKKNALLLDRLLQGSLTADELAIMSSQEMASEELQKERAQLKEEADKQAIMVREDEGPRVRRTHKGDEYVDSGEQQAVVDSVFATKPVRHRESIVELDMADGSVPANGEQGARSPDPTVQVPAEFSHSTPGQDRRTSSQQFDINNVWAKTQQSPDIENASARPQQQQPRRQSSVSKVAQPGGQTHDADVDRLLADDNDETYTPAEYNSSEPTMVWRGKLAQPGVTELTASGRYIAGNDFSRYIPWSQFLPDTLEIEGRLEKGRADDYLCGLQWSTKSDVTVIALTPYDNREAFDAIFDYFLSRKRYAVGKKGHGISDIVKDLYISPVEAGGQLPPHIDLLDYCSVQVPLTERMLFATFVVNKPASWDAVPDTPSQADGARLQYGKDASNIPAHVRDSIGPAGSPISAQPPPAFSPRPGQGFTPSDHANGAYNGGGNTFGHSSLPPNPYSAQASQAQHYQGAAPASIVQQILGPYAGSPVVQQLLGAAGNNLEEHVLKNMRDVLEREPRAREDINVFSLCLGGKA